MVTEKHIFKTTIVVQSHCDKCKQFLVHNSTNLHQVSIKLIVLIESSYISKISSLNVTQAYIQYTETLLNIIYSRPVSELNLSPEELLGLINPIQSLPDSNDSWNGAMASHLEKDLKITRTNTDIVLYFKQFKCELIGLLGQYVDNSVKLDPKPSWKVQGSQWKSVYVESEN